MNFDQEDRSRNDRVKTKSATSLDVPKTGNERRSSETNDKVEHVTSKTKITQGRKIMGATMHVE